MSKLNRLSSLFRSTFKAKSSKNTAEAKRVAKDITSILKFDSQGNGMIEEDEEELTIPWLSNVANKITSHHRKEVSRVRKGKWIFKLSQGNRFERLIRLCAKEVGTKATFEIFSKLGHGTGVKEYNAFIKSCIGKARESENEDLAIEQISHVFQLLKLMKEEGFPIEEETFAPPFKYFVDMGMEKEFYFFHDLIKDYNPCSVPKLGYYEMLLHIGINNEDKVQELCHYIATNDSDETANLRENYLLALCRSGQKSDLLQLLDIIDITKLSVDHITSIFNSLGRVSLESFAKKLLLALKEIGYGADSISNLIFNYATNVPNLAVEDVILEFKNLHSMVEMEPTLNSYEKIIAYSCDLLEVHVAFELAHQLCEAGLTLSIDTLNSLLCATEKSAEFNLVRRIYSLIWDQQLKPTTDTFKGLISLSVKMKDVDAAYSMLSDSKKFNLDPTASMYNSIIAGYFREKRKDSAVMVFKEMELAGVKPDSQTYSCLINNCNCEEEIAKYYEELKHAGISVTKHIAMALINAYGSCGHLAKAKEVILDPDIPFANLNEIRSVLVAALASNGQKSDAVRVYNEIKESGHHLEPRAAVSLIECLQSKEDLSTLLDLLEEFNDPVYWMEGCRKVIFYCVQNKHLSSAVHLLKQLRDKFEDNDIAVEVVFDETISVAVALEPLDMQIGMDLLQAIKKGLGTYPSRRSLDFLLSACIKAKDLHNALLIWEEYPKAGLPYNIMSYLWMYQALLVCGEVESARTLQSEIPKTDPHVRIIVQASQRLLSPNYVHEEKKNGGKKKKVKQSSRTQ